MSKTEIRPQSCYRWILVALTAVVFLLMPRQSHAGLSNTLTWIGTTNTNVTGSNSWSVSPAYAGVWTNGTNVGTNVFNLSNTIYQYVFTNNYSQLNGAQTFSFMNSNAGAWGFTFAGYSNVLVTNVGTFRLDSGALTATNAGGGTLTIWNTNNSQLTGNSAFLGNMNVWMNNLANHSSTARTVTNNLNLAINNLVVNSASATFVGSTTNNTAPVNFTWEGTGTNTVLGSIMVSNQTNTTGTATNAGALVVKSGTINIATTNAANRSTTATNIDNANVYGWNSGLVITNNGSVFVAGQNSLGIQAYNIKIGTTNNGTTTFGLFGSNNWATNTATIVTLTNSFDINNSGAGTNIFRGMADKTFALSGVIASANTNGTLVFQDGAITLSGANTFSNLAVVANSTVTLSGANASLGNTNAGIRITGTGALDLGGVARTNGAFTLDTGTLSNGTLTASSYALTNAGTISAVLAGSGALTKSGAGTAVLSAANTYTGATTINTGGVLAYGVSNAISTNSAVTVAGTLDLGGYTGTFGGTNGAVTNNIMLSGGTIRNGTLSLNNDLVVTNGGTISASVSGSGGINNGAIGGSGTLLISASNNYTGVTEQRGSTLKIGNNYALGATNGETWVYGGGGGLDLNGFTITDETMNLTNSSAFVTNSSASAATWAGNVKLAASGTRGFSVGTGDINVSGSISGSASRFLNKYGTGTLTLSGSNAVQGFISVNEGTLRVANAGALGLNSSLNGVGVSNGATLDLNGYTNAAASRFINIAGTGVGGNGALYNGSANAAVLSNTIAMTNNTTIGNEGNLTLSGSLIGGSYAFVTNVPSAGVTNTNFTTNTLAGVSLTKVGTGTLFLTASNSYSGGTIVSNGAVAISSGNSLGTNSTGGIGSITLAGSAGNTATLMSTLAGGTSSSMTTLTLGDVTMSGNSSLYLTNAYSQFSVTSLALSGSTNQIRINSVGWSDSGSYNLLTSANEISSPSLMRLLIGSTTLANGESTVVGRNTYTFTNSSATTYSMNVVGGAFNVIWNGSENNVWNTSATNWNQAGSSNNIAFYAGDNVTFSGLNPSGGTNIVVGQAITAGAMVVTNSWPIVLTGSNVTASSLAVQKGGNLQIGNGFTSTTDVTVDGDGGSASLEIGGGGAGTLSVGTGKIIVTNGGTLVVNKSSYTLTNQVSGNGNFENYGGTNTVTANNTYTGTTLVAGGSTLMVGNGATAGGGIATLGTGDVTVNSGATLAFNRTNTYTNANNISGVGSVSQLGTQGLELAGSNTFSGGLYLNTNANGAVWATSGSNLGSGTIYAVSSNSKIGLSKLNGAPASASMTITNALNTGTNSSYVMTFQPGTSNTYSVTLDGQITGSGMLKIGSSAATNSSGVLGTGVGNLYVNNTNNNYSGGTELGNGRIIIGNGLALGSGAISFSSTNLGNTILQVTNDTTLSQNFTLGASASNSTAFAVFDVSSAVTLNGVLSNRASTQIGSLIKTGSGTLTLSNASTYTGGTVVSAGTLAYGVDNVLANSGAVTVDNATVNIGSYSDTVGAVVVTNGGRITGTTGILTGSSYASGVVGATNTISANLAGNGNLIFTGNTNTTVLSGSNTYSGNTDLSDTTSTNMTLRVSSTNSLSANSSLLGSSAAARTPTLDLAAAGDYKMQSFKGGNMVFLATNGDATISFTNATVTNQMTAGDKSFYATNVNVSFAGALDVSPTTANKEFRFFGDGDYTFNGSIVNTNTTYTASMVVGTTGTVTLNASNNYNGTTTVSNSATLVLGNANALGTTSAGTTVTNGSTLDLGGQSISGEALAIQGAGVSSAGAIKNSSANAATWSGAVTLNTNTTVNVTSGDVTISGNIGEANTSTLTKAGTGLLTLSGSNNYSGGTLVSAGTLSGDTTSLLRTITNNGTVRFNQATNGTYSGVMSGTGLLAKTNSGTLTLSGANTYSGATTVNQGTLLVATNGSIASSSLATVNGGLLQVNGTAGAVTVNRGGGLGGTGTVGAVTLKDGSFLKPGNSPGLLTASLATWEAGSTYNWEIDNADGTAGTNWDLFSVTGALDLSALSSSAKMNLVLESLSTVTNFSATNPDSWVFAQAGSLVGTAFSAGADVTDLFNINATAFNDGVGPANGWRVEVGSTGTTLNLMAVPEPSTGSMLGLGLAGLVVTRLFRRKIS